MMIDGNRILTSYLRVIRHWLEREERLLVEDKGLELT